MRSVSCACKVSIQVRVKEWYIFVTQNSLGSNLRVYNIKNFLGSSMPQFHQQMRVTHTLNVPMLCLCKLAHPGYTIVSVKCFMSHNFYGSIVSWLNLRSLPLIVTAIPHKPTLYMCPQNLTSTTVIRISFFV